MLAVIKLAFGGGVLRAPSSYRSCGMSDLKPIDLKSNIDRAFGRHYLDVREAMKASALPFVSLDVLDGLESYVAAKPKSAVVPL
jgi:hypothetical protein